MTEHRAPAFRALARAHLRTPAERAVFGVLASARGWWTAASAARASGVGGLDADQALRRFAAAGIVDQDDGPAGRRYRYRAEMDYLHADADADADAGVDDELRDPVCGMPVAADTPHVADDHGRVVRFCSIPCVTLWRRAQRRGRAR